MLTKIAKLHAGGSVMLARIEPQEVDGKPLLTFIGTAFMCHGKGYLLTAAHPINLTDKLCVVPAPPFDKFNPLSSAQFQFFFVEVAQFDAINDVALLRLPAGVTITVPTNTLGDEGQVPVGSSLAYLGYPYAQMAQHALKVSSSVLSAKVVSQAGTKQIQFDAMVETGNSGGPLIDVATGKIVAIVSGRFSPSGNQVVAQIGNHVLGTESSISYAVGISYGKALMISEGLHA